MGDSFKILFYTKRKEKLKNGQMPIMCKISVNGRFCTFSTSLSVEERMWDSRRKRLKGRSEQARRTNELLDSIQYAVYDAYMRLKHLPDEVTPQAVRMLYSGQRSSSIGIVEFFGRHNEEFAQMVGLNRSKSTLYKYRQVCKHLHAHITAHYGLSDMPVTRVDRKFICEFHRWLTETAKCSVNTVWIYMIAFKHVVTQAVACGIISRNPFTGYKLHCRHTDKSFLMRDELRRFIEFKPSTQAQCRVIDAFIFSCFTGLSFSDVKRLTMADIVRRNDRYYVSTYRKNNWCNTVLRMAADRMGINKRISFHTARHTFATTVTLANGIPIEVVSRMLGHVSIKTTQTYARVLQTSISNEMSRASKNIESNYHIPDRLMSRTAPHMISKLRRAP